MKIVCISDTHEKHRQVKLPAGDILIHAGDYTWVGDPGPTLDFLEWFEAQPFEHKITVCGNHDFYFEDKNNLSVLRGRKCHFLMNESVRIGSNLNVWGSPFTPRFMDWAFMAGPEKIAAIWAGIPEGLDILITHGPPFGILDRTARGDRVGCPELLKAVQVKKPKIHVFGHIHEGYGIVERGGTIFINASLCDEMYSLANEPAVVEL